MTEGRFRKRDQTDGGKGQAKGEDWRREAKAKGSRLTEGRIRQREQTDRGKDKAKRAD